MFPYLLIGQQPTIDSLKTVLKFSKNDTLRSKILCTLIAIESNDKIWDAYNQELIKIVTSNLKIIPNQEVDTQNVFLKFYSIAINNSGYIKYKQGNLQVAINEFMKNLKIQEAIHDKTGTLRTLINIGNIYSDQDDKEKALIQFQKAFNISKEVSDQDGMTLSLINIGNIYMNKEDFERALENYLEALVITKEKNDEIGMASCYYKISLIYKTKKETDKALFYNNKSLETSRAMNDERGLAISLNNNAELLFEKGEINEAFLSAADGLRIAKELGYPEEIMNSTQILTKIYKNQNKPSQALEMYEVYVKMHDSLNNESTRKASIKSQLKYDYEKKEAILIEHQEKERLLSEEQNRRQRIVIWFVAGGFLLVTAFAGIVFFTLKTTRKQKVIIEEKQKEIIDSITYAKRIQTALLTSEKYIERNLKKLQKS